MNQFLISGYELVRFTVCKILFFLVIFRGEIYQSSLYDLSQITYCHVLIVTEIKIHKPPPFPVSPTVYTPFPASAATDVFSVPSILRMAQKCVPL